jgi:long-chain acyl-CoA synthetase
LNPVWLKHYPPGVAAEIDVDPSRTLVDAFEDACTRFAERPAFNNLGHTISYAELDGLSKAFAANLQQQFGLQAGDRVAIMMPNLLQYPVALFGILRAGLIVVNVNPLYKPHELEHQLKDSGARAIVIVANSAHVLEAALPNTSIEHVIVTQIGDLLPTPKKHLVNFVVRYLKRMVPAYRIAGARKFSEFIEHDRAQFVRPENINGRSIAFLQYTGGTTGLSKGAMLTHTNLLSNVEQITTWFDARIEPGADIIITALPLYHVYSMTCNCLSYLVSGALNVLITDPRDTAGLIGDLKSWPFTAITGVNTLYQSLVDHPDFMAVDFSALRLVSAGGMACMEFTTNKWLELTGVPILEGYGLSETSPVVTSNPLDITGYTGSIGLPLPSTHISLRDDDNNEVSMGETGEICIRGPQVMPGYWNQPDATANVMTSDGYLKTGDLAIVDADGFFKIVDRKKDMIVVSGFNVYPNEIENVITNHPEVTEVACIGVPDGYAGEAVKVFVVRAAGSRLTEQAVRDYCREELTGYKRPKYIDFHDSLPKSNVGKVLRRKLRDEN